MAGAHAWRGAANGRILTALMYIAGGMSAKIALYPIAPGSTADKRLTNWAIVSRSPTARSRLGTPISGRGPDAWRR